MDGSLRYLGEVISMNNTSIKQLDSEIKIARKQAKSFPYRFERNDTAIEDGNSLSDLMTLRNIDSTTGMQIVPPLVKKKIDEMFEMYTLQYEILGLYYAAGFTIDEISVLENMQRDSVNRSLRRAVKRLQKYLTESEYDSIRWLLRDYKGIPSNLTRSDRSQLTSYTCQGKKSMPYHEITHGKTWMIIDEYC